MAVTKTLSEFKSRLAGGGARPNLFEVTIPSFPSSVSEAGEVVIRHKVEHLSSCVRLQPCLRLTWQLFPSLSEVEV